MRITALPGQQACNEEIRGPVTPFNTTSKKKNLDPYVLYDSEEIRSVNTIAIQETTLFALGVTPCKQEIINRAVEAKRNGDHRLARLLAHQVVCSQECIGPRTKKLLERLTTEPR